MFDNLFGPDKYDFHINKEAQTTNSKVVKAAAVADGLGATLNEAAAMATRRSMPSTIDFLAKDAFIKDEMLKLAGMMLTDATPEGIESFLKQYMYNELAFFPDKIAVSIDLMPTREEPMAQGTIDVSIVDATGNINLAYANVIIQIPFIIRDREVLPFDAIQMGNERAVFTRENMKNILFNIKEKATRQQATPYSGSDSLSGFVGVDQSPTDSPLADTGWMDELLRIQSSLGHNHGMEDFGVYSAYVEELLEKTAGIRKVDIDYSRVEKDLYDEYLVNAEKVANEEFVEDEDLRLKKEAALATIDERVFADVGILRNSARFSFVEKDGRLVSDVPGVLFTTLIGVAGPAPERMVVAADGRYKLLLPGQKFLFNANNEVLDFTLPTTKIGGLNPGDTVAISINGIHSLPIVITKVISNASGLASMNVDKFVYGYDTHGDEVVIIATGDANDNQLIFQSKKRVMARIAQHESGKNLTYYNMYLKSKVPVLCIAPETTFLKLKPGTIGNISANSEFILTADDNIKLASTENVVHVVKVSETPEPKYTISINWQDQKYKSSRTTTFQRIKESKLLGILKIIGFDYAKSSEILHRASKGGAVESPILPGMTPWAVKPELSAVAAVSKSITDMRKALFSGDNAKSALGNIGAGLIAGSSSAAHMFGDTLGELSAYADESAALAEKLEKIAISKQSNEFRKIASLMVIKNRVDNMMRDALGGGEFVGAEVLAELHKLDPYMEKVAHDLVELKVAQAVKRNEVISPNIISATMRHLDNLHKYASHFKQASVLGTASDVKRSKTKAILDNIRETDIGPMGPAIKPSGKELIPGAKAVSSVVNSNVGQAGIMGAVMVNRLKK